MVPWLGNGCLLGRREGLGRCRDREGAAQVLYRTESRL
jgi:hypothetical protein